MATSNFDPTKYGATPFDPTKLGATRVNTVARTPNPATVDNPQLGGNTSQQNAFKTAQTLGVAKFGQGLATTGREFAGSTQQTGDETGQMLRDQQSVINKIHELRAQGVPNTDLRVMQLTNYLKRTQGDQAVTQAQIDPGTQLSNKEVLGSAGNVALLATAGGELKGAGLAADAGGVGQVLNKTMEVAKPVLEGGGIAGKVLRGAALGYAGDVANAANADKGEIYKPGVGTIVGGTLPIVGKVGGAIAKRFAGFESGAGTTVIQRAIDNPDEVNAAIKKFAAAPEAKQQLVDSVESTLHGLAQERNTAFGDSISKMAAKEPIAQDTAVKAFLKNVNQTGFGGTIDEAGNLTFSNSKLTTADKTALTGAWEDIKNWSDFTPQGMDNLRQNIGNYMNEFKMTGNARASVVLGAVKKELTAELTAKIPGYAKTLADYGDKSSAIESLAADLTTHSNSPSTQLNKIMRIFKKDPSVIKTLTEQVGEQEANRVLNEVAGAILSDWVNPTLKQGFKAAGDIAGGAAALMAGHPVTAAVAGAGLAATSPRISGKGAVLAGQAIQSGVTSGIRKAATIGASKAN